MELNAPTLALSQNVDRALWTLRRGLWVVCGLGMVWILFSSWMYVLPDGAHPFLDERVDLASWKMWRIQLAIHVAGGLFCLPVGLILIWPRAVGWFPRGHAILGRAYVFIFVSVLFPTGVFLSIFAKGGWATGTGFFLSTTFGTFATIMGVRSILRGNVRGHQNWMLRSFAQIASAVTFRVVHLGLQGTDVPYEWAYLIALWVSVFGNAVLAELIVATSAKKEERR